MLSTIPSTIDYIFKALRIPIERYDHKHDLNVDRLTNQLEMRQLVPFKFVVEDLFQPSVLFASHQYSPWSLRWTESKANIE